MYESLVSSQSRISRLSLNQYSLVLVTWSTCN